MTDTASAAPTYQQVIAAWNAQADEYNQWDALGEDEKIEWAVACAKAAPPAVVEPLTADGMKEPKNGQHWRVEWWNESCRMMLPTNKKLDHFQSFKNGTLMFTIKQAAHGIGIKDGDSHGLPT